MFIIPESLTLDEAIVCMNNYIKIYPKFCDGVNYMTGLLNSYDVDTQFFNLELISIICFLYPHIVVIYSTIEYLTVKKENNRVHLVLNIKDREPVIIGYVALLKLLYLHYGYTKQSFIILRDRK